MSLFRVPLCSCTISFGEFVCSRVIWCPALVGNGESVLSVKIAERTYKIRQERKHYAAEKKVSILRRHLLDEVAVSDLCEELGLQSRVFYPLHKEFIENGAVAFQTKERPRRESREKQKLIEFLEKKVAEADQGRGPGRVDGGADRAKKALGDSDCDLGAASCAA
jgi:transposase